jgi:uncharacterized protein YdhG (YjbR/CyaY superfamily)
MTTEGKQRESTKRPKTVEEYIMSCPLHVRTRLEEMRTIVISCVPACEELISYGMPAIRNHGVIVYYAANKNHIGFYPTPSAIEAFAEELKDLRTSKGAIQLPLDKPLPVALIKKIVKFRVKEDQSRSALRKRAAK